MGSYMRGAVVAVGIVVASVLASAAKPNDVKLEVRGGGRYVLEGATVPLEELKWAVRGMVSKGPVRVVIYKDEDADFKAVGLAVRAVEAGGATTAMAVSGPRNR
jgi:biopolymer transport protein ExbD